MKCLIAFGNALFFNLFQSSDTPFFETYASMLLGCIVLGAIPSIFFIKFQKLASLKEKEQKIIKLNQLIDELRVIPSSDLKIQFPNEKGEIELQIDSSDVIFIKSESNYLEIYSENDSKFILRNRLKQIEKILPNSFLRCHRSYIVNRDKVKTINGGKRGYVLSLHGTSLTIPVSRSQIDNFNRFLEHQ